MLQELARNLLAALAVLAAPAAVAGSCPHRRRPGHGGFQEGAVSAYGMAEKELSLRIARYLKEALQKGWARKCR